MPTIMPTVTRKPRMQGFPPMTSGFNVIRVSCFMELIIYVLKVYEKLSYLNHFNSTGSDKEEFEAMNRRLEKLIKCWSF